MAGVVIALSIDGDAAMAEALGTMIERGENLRPMWNEIGFAMVQSTIARFRTGIDPQGYKWTPSDMTRKRTKQTMVETQNLQNSFSPDTVHVDDVSVEWGTPVDYAAIHQFGFDGLVAISAHDRKVKSLFGIALGEEQTIHIPQHTRQVFMPPRPFIGISDDDRIAIEDIMAKEIAPEGSAP